MTTEYYSNIVINELTQDGGVYFARYEETSTKNMAMNRSKRIQAINIYLCKDIESEGFKHWELFENIQDPNKCLCICGMELEKEAYHLTRKDGSIQICIGSKCIEEMNKVYKSNIQVEIKNDKDERKVCPFCNKRKAMKDEMCKKCSACDLCKLCKTPNTTSDYDLCKPGWLKEKHNYSCPFCKKSKYIEDVMCKKCSTCSLCEVCKTPNYTSDYSLCKPCWFNKRENRDVEEDKHKCTDCARIIDNKYLRCYNCNLNKKKVYAKL